MRASSNTAAPSKRRASFCPLLTVGAAAVAMQSTPGRDARRCVGTQPLPYSTKGTAGVAPPGPSRIVASALPAQLAHCYPLSRPGPPTTNPCNLTLAPLPRDISINSFISFCRGINCPPPAEAGFT